MQPSVSVIIVTLDRPQCVRKCIEHLLAQTRCVDQIIVVDASDNSLTAEVCLQFTSVVYLRNENGYGRMTASRNIGLKAADGEIIAFVDDDAFAHAGWLEALVLAYSDDRVGAVGGRVLSGTPHDGDGIAADEIGQLRPDGTLTAAFAGDPGRVIEVDHVMGCNMSFRREVLAQLGGFREDFPGISGIREDSDMCLRVKRAGYRVVFNPEAAVDHLGAPQATGKRFDYRYIYYLQRNHFCLLIRNYGLASTTVWRYVGLSAYGPILECVRRIGAAGVRLAASMVGTLAGMAAGVALLARVGRTPVRADAEGRRITAALADRTAATPAFTDGADQALAQR